jgi:hypothetical protein
LGDPLSGVCGPTFVEIVESLVDHFDLIEVLTSLVTRCVELLDASAAGILLVDDGHFRVVGASSEQAQMMELFEVQRDQGPGVDSYRTGQVVAHSDLRGPSPWPAYGALSVTAAIRRCAPSRSATGPRRLDA